MKWRMLDRVVAFQPWQRLAAVKAVSFEELTLLERWGRAGELPASLCLELGVEAARWLAVASSDYEFAAALSGIAGFQCAQPVGRGPLEVTVEIQQRDAAELRAWVAIHETGGRVPVAQGAMVFGLVPLAECFDREWAQGMWQELCRGHGAAR